MPTAAAIALVSAIGYLLGSIPVANRIARRAGTVDLRAVGDRNPGYWNMKAQLGAARALPVFIGDVAKGATAAGVGALAAGDGQWWFSYVGGMAAMIGHAWPLFAQLRGGRSVLTFVGAVLIAAPLPAAAAIVVLIVVWLASRSFAWAARGGMIAFPIAQLLIDGPERTAASGVLMTFIGVRFAQAAVASRSGERAAASDPA